MSNLSPYTVFVRNLLLLAMLSSSATLWGQSASSSHSDLKYIVPVQRYPASQVRRTAAANFLYYGGRVISNVQVDGVFWGNAVDAGEQNNAPGFYAAITASPWMDVLSQYSTVGLNGVVDGLPGSNQIIGQGGFGNSYTITPTNANTALNDLDIQNELTSQINSGALPQPQTDAGGNINTIYMVYFPLSVTITDPNGGVSCKDFCAYHGTLVYNGKSVAYGVVPDQSPASLCTGGCGPNANYINNLDSTCSHELAESVTDLEVGIGLTINRPLAWYDTNNGEIGDICNQKQGTVAGYTVQAVWSNADAACVVTSNAVGKPTLTQLLSSKPSAKFRDAITFTATVTSASGTPVGTVQFEIDGLVIATKPLNAGGIAALNLNGLPAGVHTVQAVYSGNASFAGSAGQLLQNRTPKPH